MSTDFLRFFYQRPDIKFNRKIFVFLICLVISFFTWLQLNLSKQHVDVVPVKVDFVNLPKSRFGFTKLSDTLLVEVEADGYGLLKYEMQEVSVDFRKLKKDINSGLFYFLPNNYTKTIGKHMGDNFKMIRAIVDTVRLNPVYDNMKVVGITGGIGSGKTTVCRLFELLGVPVFYADDEAKKLYDDVRIRAQVMKLFGKNVLGKGKEIDKKKLAEIVFSNRALLANLNGIIHPAVLKRFDAWKKKQKGSAMVIKEAAIMIESGANKGVDYLVSVSSPNDLKINRLIKSRGMSSGEIDRRMMEQISDKERAKYSDEVILNDEQHSLIEQVLKLHKKLSRK